MATSTLLAEINLISNLTGPAQDLTDYFEKAKQLQNSGISNTPTPLQTFIASSTAFHLNCNPDICCPSVDDIANIFNLLDLHPSLAGHI